MNAAKSECACVCVRVCCREVSYQLVSECLCKLPLDQRLHLGWPQRPSTYTPCLILRKRCVHEEDCTVAVFVNTKPGDDACWLKTAQDAAGGSVNKPGRTSCTKVPAPPSPPKVCLCSPISHSLFLALRPSATTRRVWCAPRHPARAA